MSSTRFYLKFTLIFCLIAYRASALSIFRSFTDFSEYLTTIVAKNELSPVHSFCNYYRVFSHDVTAAILVSQNNETAAMLVSQTNPVGVKLFSYANAFFCSNKFA